jgi:hypothetical protein
VGFALRQVAADGLQVVAELGSILVTSAPHLLDDRI